MPASLVAGGSMAPIENSPPGIHTIPSGVREGAGAGFGTVGRKLPSELTLATGETATAWFVENHRVNATAATVIATAVIATADGRLRTCVFLTTGVRRSLYVPNLLMLILLVQTERVTPRRGFNSGTFSTDTPVFAKQVFPCRLRQLSAPPMCDLKYSAASLYCNQQPETVGCFKTATRDFATAEPRDEGGLLYGSPCHSLSSKIPNSCSAYNNASRGPRQTLRGRQGIAPTRTTRKAQQLDAGP